MIVTWLPLLVCVAGLLTYAFVPKAAELGKIAFAVGLLVVMLHASGGHLP